MIVEITVKHRETRSKAWMTRRCRNLMRKVLFAISTAPVLASGGGDAGGVDFQMDTFMDACRCTVEFPDDWSHAQVDAFVRQMKDQKNFSVQLILPATFGTMQP